MGDIDWRLDKNRLAKESDKLEKESENIDINNIEQVEKFINNVYISILCRDADEFAKKEYVRYIMSGTIIPKEMIRELIKDFIKYGDRFFV